MAGQSRTYNYVDHADGDDSHCSWCRRPLWGSDWYWVRGKPVCWDCCKPAGYAEDAIDAPSP